MYPDGKVSVLVEDFTLDNGLENRTGARSGNGASTADLVQLEIEARLMMIRYRHRWGLMADEIREVISEVRRMKETGVY